MQMQIQEQLRKEEKKGAVSLAFPYNIYVKVTDTYYYWFAMVMGNQFNVAWGWFDPSRLENEYMTVDNIFGTFLLKDIPPGDEVKIVGSCTMNKISFQVALAKERRMDDFVYAGSVVMDMGTRAIGVNENSTNMIQMDRDIKLSMVDNAVASISNALSRDPYLSMGKSPNQCLPPGECPVDWMLSHLGDENNSKFDTCQLHHIGRYPFLDDEDPAIQEEMLGDLV